jgi:TonB family protein
METGLSGAVDLQFNVNPDGSTSNVEVMRAEPGDAFVPSAINAVRQWRFAERDDVVRARVRLRFDPQATE